MSQFKNNSDFILYYSDTDSIYINKPLNESFISNTILGKLKLEGVYNKTVFLSSKVYCLSDNGKIIYKVKGLKHTVDLSMEDFENLLFKESFLQKLHTKFVRNLDKGHIQLLEQLYTIQVTENKRKLIYDVNNKLIGTTPYIINSNKDIINKYPLF
jgi:hypothetical protein